MSKIEKHAVELAKEMVEHNLKNGAISLDLDFIAKDACELAHKIHELAKQYEIEDVEDIEKLIDKRIQKHLTKSISPASHTINHG